MDRVASAFPAKEPQDIEEFFLLSRTFAERSGLVTPRVQQILDWCDEAGVLASMTMLGEGVFAYGKGAREVLARAGGPYELHIADQGPGILEAAV
jgi:pantoate kinase